MAALLDRGPRAGGHKTWVPCRIGPRFEWLDHESIRIADGPLIGRRFALTIDLKANTAGALLHDGSQPVGQVEIERDPPGKGVVLWNVAVREHMRRSGLATIMTWCVFRELLAAQDSATFRIRMVQSLRPGTSGVGVQNIGMGVIAARLGFRPESHMERIVRRENITGIEPLPGMNGDPPALKVIVKGFPLVVVGFVLNPDTMKPISDHRVYVQLRHDEHLIQKWLRRGLLFVNGNYSLREPGIERFVNVMATDASEAKLFRGKVRGL